MVGARGRDKVLRVTKKRKEGVFTRFRREIEGLEERVTEKASVR